MSGKDTNELRNEMEDFVEDGSFLVLNTDVYKNMARYADRDDESESNFLKTVRNENSLSAETQRNSILLTNVNQEMSFTKNRSSYTESPTRAADSDSTLLIPCISNAANVSIRKLESEDNVPELLKIKEEFQKTTVDQNLKSMIQHVGLNRTDEQAGFAEQAKNISEYHLLEKLEAKNANIKANNVEKETRFKDQLSMTNMSKNTDCTELQNEVQQKTDELKLHKSQLAHFYTLLEEQKKKCKDLELKLSTEMKNSTNKLMNDVACSNVESDGSDELCEALKTSNKEVLNLRQLLAVSEQELERFKKTSKEDSNTILILRNILENAGALNLKPSKDNTSLTQENKRLTENVQKLTHDNSTLLNSLEDVRTRYESQKSEILTLTRAYQTAQGRILQFQGFVRDGQKKIEASDADISSLKQALKCNNSKFEKLNADQQKTNEEILCLKKTIQNATSYIGQLQQEIQTLDLRNREKNHEILELRGNMRSLASSEPDDKVEHLENQVKVFKADFAALELQRKQIELERNALSDQLLKVKQSLTIEEKKRDEFQRAYYSSIAKRDAPPLDPREVTLQQDEGGASARNTKHNPGNIQDKKPEVTLPPCPMCNQRFADIDALTQHAAGCNGQPN